jgi:hypothetical protein
MSNNFYRPAKQSPDPFYPFSDPAWEFVPGAAGLWVGDLARHFRIEGHEVTKEHLKNLHAGRSPDGSQVLIPIVDPDKYVPMHGGNCFISTDLNALIASKAPSVIKTFERPALEAAKEMVEEHLLPKFYARLGADGREHVPVAMMAAIGKHAYGSRGDYLLHVSVTIPAVGKTADGQFFSVDNYPNFKHQKLASLGFAGRVVGKYYRQHGLILSPELEVKGMEAMRGVKTERSEEIRGRLAQKGLPATPETRQYTSQETHRPRDPRVTVHDLINKTRDWIRAKGIDVRRAVVDVYRKTSDLAERRKATAAVKRAARAVDRIGRPVSKADFQKLALREALNGRAQVDRVERLVKDVLKSKARFGLMPLPDGRVTTSRIEKSRATTHRAVQKLSRKRGRQPKPLAYHKLTLGQNAPHARQEEAARGFSRKGMQLAELTPAAAVFVRACMADGRRVLAVAGERTARGLRDALGVSPQDPEALAGRLGKTPRAEAFRAVRRQRWYSLRHLERLTQKARAPKLYLNASDVVVLDTRGVDQHAVRAIAAKAKAAKATLILIDDGPTPARTRSRSQSHQR